MAGVSCSRLCASRNVLDGGAYRSGRARDVARDEGAGEPGAVGGGDAGRCEPAASLPARASLRGEATTGLGWRTVAVADMLVERAREEGEGETRWCRVERRVGGGGGRLAR